MYSTFDERKQNNRFQNQKSDLTFEEKYKSLKIPKTAAKKNEDQEL